MKKFTLFFILISFSFYIYGQRVNTTPFAKETEKIDNSLMSNSKVSTTNHNNKSGGLSLVSIAPQFDWTNYGTIGGGTYCYYPATSPTRIVNSAKVSNTANYTQTNTVLTVSINGSTPYLETSGTGQTINVGDDTTLTVGYDTAFYTTPFYLNTTDFSSPIGAQSTIHQTYKINYSLTSDSCTTAVKDSFTFNVGYVGNPYTGGPDLEYSYARSNQNPSNPTYSPKSYMFGGTNGDGVYTPFSIWDENGTTIISSMDIFLGNQCTFDPTTNVGVNITGVIYKFDYNAGDWVHQISSAPIDLVPADKNKWKHIDFLLDGMSEYLTDGDYIVGIEIIYNGYDIFLGYDNTTVQYKNATVWYFPISPMPYRYSRSAFPYAVMINANVFSNPLATKYTKDNNIVNIYPNPSDGIVSIVTPENSTIKVYNLLGVNVATVENSSTFNSLDLSELPNGNYIVRVTNNGKVTTKKLNIVK